MKRNPCKLYSALLSVLLLSAPAWAQKQEKTFTSGFKTNKDVKVIVETGYSDVILETWNKNEVAVEAVMEVEGVSEKEAQELFREWGLEAVGGKDQVRISTRPATHAMYMVQGSPLPEDFEFDFDFTFDDSLMAPVVPPAPPMPPMPVKPVSPNHPVPPPPPVPPHMDKHHFDYEAYEREGDAYMKKWQEEFRKEFDAQWKAEFDQWRKEFEREMKNHEQIRKEMEMQRAEMMKQHEDVLRNRDSIKAQIRREFDRAKTEQLRAEKKAVRYMIRTGEANKNVKVKKTIRIKMPKDAKLELKVRHGEVILSENLKHIDARLDYSSLTAVAVNGKETVINASYTPVRVEQWNAGSLRVEYAKAVNLKRVQSLKLDAVSSRIDIGAVLDEALIAGRFGDLSIGSLSPQFKLLDLQLDNTDTRIVLPKNTAYTYQFSGVSSDFSAPKALSLNFSSKYGKKLAKGYVLSAAAPRSVVIQAQYSDVVLQ